MHYDAEGTVKCYTKQPAPAAIARKRLVQSVCFPGPRRGRELAALEHQEQ
jgi:hypothetical protein